MTDHPQARDDVLFAFHEACPRPTAEQIIDWTSRYPQFAEDTASDNYFQQAFDSDKGFAERSSDPTRGRRDDA